MSLKASIEHLSAQGEVEHDPEARKTFLEFRDQLTEGKIRAAEKIVGEWKVNAWVKQGILLGFRLGQMVEDAAVWCAVHGLVIGDRANQVCHTSHPSRSWIDWLLVFVSVLAKACILGGLTLSENFL